MTTPEMALGVEPRHAPPAPVQTDDPRRRRKMLILFILGAILVALVAFTAWYLLFRKPISQIIPPPDTFAMPTFSYAAYELTSPLGIATTADGSRIYVTQTGGTQETLVLDGTGNKLGVLKPPDTISAHATQMYVAVDPRSGEVYATDRAAGQVYVYGPQGDFEKVFAPNPAISGFQPMAIHVDASRNVFIADASGAFQRIHQFDPTGRLIRDFGAQGDIAFANGIATDKAGNVYVTSSNQGRLLFYGPTGDRLGLIDRGPTHAGLGLPRGLAIDDQDRVYVVDSVAQSVQVYKALSGTDTAPRYVDRFGSEGTVDGTFEFPNGIAVDTRGHLYVADWNNDRIQVWSY
jgi:DNA-binding beta-propeller fold protein YncE